MSLQVCPRVIGQNGGMTTPGHLELPRPWRLLLTVGWNLAESLGLPVVGYLVGARLGGGRVPGWWRRRPWCG